MKIFLSNIGKAIERWSNALDAKTVLCSKAWIVPNTEGVKQVFIFKPDGTLTVSIDGNVTPAKWEYQEVMQSVVVTTGNKSIMFNPRQIDDNVFMLQKDGTEECALLVDNEKIGPLQLGNLQNLIVYISNPQEYIREIEKAEQQKLIEAQNTKKREEEKERLEEERRLREQIEYDKWIETNFIGTDEEIQKLEKKKKIISIVAVTAIVVAVGAAGAGAAVAVAIAAVVVAGVIVAGVAGVVDNIDFDITEKNSEIKKQHPIDEYRMLKQQELTNIKAEN